MMKPEWPVGQDFVAERIAPHLTASRGWLAIAGLVAVYELSCPDNELLSEGVDRALQKHPLLTATAIGYTAAHLTNLLPEQLDLFHRLFEG